MNERQRIAAILRMHFSTDDPGSMVAIAVRDDEPLTDADWLSVADEIAGDRGGWPPEFWYHAAHGLHDEAHHQAHRPLDICVPLNAARPPIVSDADLASRHDRAPEPPL